MHMMYTWYIFRLKTEDERKNDRENEKDNWDKKI